MTLDLLNDGEAYFFGDAECNMEASHSLVMDLVSTIEVGSVVPARVLKVMDYGIMLQLNRSQETILYSSDLTHYNHLSASMRGQKDLNDIVRVGMMLDVKVTDVDQVHGTMRVSRKVLLDGRRKHLPDTDLKQRYEASLEADRLEELNGGVDQFGAASFPVHPPRGWSREYFRYNVATPTTKGERDSRDRDSREGRDGRDGRDSSSRSADGGGADGTKGRGGVKQTSRAAPRGSVGPRRDGADSIDQHVIPGIGRIGGTGAGAGAGASSRAASRARKVSGSRTRSPGRPKGSLNKSSSTSTGAATAVPDGDASTDTAGDVTAAAAGARGGRKVAAAPKKTRPARSARSADRASGDDAGRPRPSRAGSRAGSSPRAPASGDAATSEPTVTFSVSFDSLMSTETKEK